MSDHLPDLYTGAPNAPETVMVLPRASKPAAEPAQDEPITVLVAARTVGGGFEIPVPRHAVEDRTAPQEPDAPQPGRDTPQRIKRPRMWDLGREQKPDDTEPDNDAQRPQQPEDDSDTPPPRAPQQPDDAPRIEQPEPAQPDPAPPRYNPDWHAQAWANARHYYDLHVNEETGWNWPRIKWAWRWTAPAGLGWGINLIHSETALLNWFHDPATGFWTGAVLAGAGGWLVWKTRRQRPIIAWITRIPLATITAAWLALPVTMPALAALTATALHTTAGVIDTLTHR